MISGLAVAAWGDPRVTRDVDLKVRLGRDSAQYLLDLLDPDYVALQADPLAALQQLGFVFVLDGRKTRLDLLLAETSFDEAAIARGGEVELAPGRSVRLCTAEDLVIYKLVATRARDHDDARGVIRRQRDRLDDAYVLAWLREFEQALDDATLVSTYMSLRGAR